MCHGARALAPGRVRVTPESGGVGWGCAKTITVHRNRLISWESARKLLLQHARFAPQLGEKPRKINVVLRTPAPQQKNRLFNNLVGATEQLCWHFEAKRLGRFEVDH